MERRPIDAEMDPLMNTHLSPAPLIELATAYWGSATLIAGVRLDIFSHISGGANRLDSLSKAIGAPEEALDALLAGLVSLELLTLDMDVYTNSAMAETYLVEGKPGFLGPAMLYNGDVFPLWNRLDRVIAEGGTQTPPDAYLGDDETKTRNFVYGMHHRALGVGRLVSKVMNFDGRTLLADIGGGPGTYSALLSEQHPGLHAEVLDLPGVVRHAADIVQVMGAAERVTCKPFDYYQDELPAEHYDAALISGVLHREQPDGARQLFAKAARALRPGGVLYISDVMLDDNRTGPLFGTMFALNMRILAHDGRCHSVAEQTQWLKEVGLEVTHHQRLPAPINYTIIRAEKTK